MLRAGYAGSTGLLAWSEADRLAHVRVLAPDRQARQRPSGSPPRPPGKRLGFPHPGRQSREVAAQRLRIQDGVPDLVAFLPQERANTAEAEGPLGSLEQLRGKPVSTPPPQDELGVRSAGPATHPH